MKLGIWSEPRMHSRGRMPSMLVLASLGACFRTLGNRYKDSFYFVVGVSAC